MMFSYLLTIFFSLVVITNCDTDTVLLKLKSDVSKVGQDFENLIFDSIRKLVDGSVYQDYYSSEEATTRHTIAKKILDDAENTTEEYRTEEMPSLENSTHYEEILHNRIRRTVENSSRDAEIATVSSVSNETCCIKTLEIPQIDELKEEIKKLHDLVVLLKDQQKIISLLDKNSKNDIPSRFRTGDVLKILDYVNTKDQKDGYASPTELSSIKNDVKEAIATLNQTKHILAMERKKELLLEKELSDQKLDIKFLKMMVEKIYKNNMNTIADNPSGGDTLGTTKDLDSTKMISDEPAPRIGSSAGASDLDDLDLERLVRKLNQPKSTDVELKISELQRELDKKKQEEDVLKQLKLLTNQLEQKKKHQSDSEITKKLHSATKTTDQASTRDLDEDIEAELQKLNEAIENLKPSDYPDSITDETRATEESEVDRKQFQAMLKKMFAQQNRKKSDETKGFQMTKDAVHSSVAKEESLLLREIIELRRQLAGFEKPQFGSGYNYVSGDMIRQRPDQGTLHQNTQYNFEPNTYQTPLVPFDQNRYQSPPVQTNNFGMPLYGYNPPKANPLVEHGEIPFTISVLPSHKAFNLDANSLDDVQNSFHQDRGQFFPATTQEVNTKPLGEYVMSPEVPSRSGASQSGAYPPKTAGHADLRGQIYDLQRVVDGLKGPNRTQTLQDEEKIADLEKQINDLKGIINSPNPDISRKYHPIPTDGGQNQNYFTSGQPVKSRRRKSIENDNMGPGEDSQLYDQVASGLKKLIFEKGNNVPEGDTYDGIQSRIDHLRYQLERGAQSKEGVFNPILSTNIYQPPYASPNVFPTKTIEVQPKKNDVLTSLVVKIVEKIIAATPAVLEKLFGRGFSDLSNFGEYSNNDYYDGGQNDVAKLFKSLGFFGYGPLIFLRVADGFATFVRILKKNELFKKFSTPASIFLLVGGVVFLTWWLQPDVDSGPRYNDYNEPYPNYNYNRRKYSDRNNNTGYGVSYNKPPFYSGGYFEGGRQQGSFIT